MSGVYYNDSDETCCAWLKELMAAGLIPHGDIDGRSIRYVKPEEVRHYTQRHWFAGIGGWAYALRLAGWGERSCDTGSCPCQPFSPAGRRRGVADERHLWPVLHGLIRECRPDTFFGEQVAGADGIAWLDAVAADLEACGYAVGAASLCAAAVGAPHERQRLYFVAHANGAGRGVLERKQSSVGTWGDAHGRGEDDRVADSGSGRLARPEAERGSGEHAGRGGGRAARGPVNGFWRDAEWLPCRDGKLRPAQPGAFPLVAGVPRSVGRLRDPSAPHHPAEARTMRIAGYGNAIVPELAAEFIAAYLDARVVDSLDGEP